MNAVADAREHGRDPTPSLCDTIAETLNIGVGGSSTGMQPNPDGSEYKYGPDSDADASADASDERDEPTTVRTER